MFEVDQAEVFAHKHAVLDAHRAFVFATDDPTELLLGHGWAAEAIPYNEVARRVGTEFPFRQGGQVVIARR